MPRTKAALEVPTFASWDTDMNLLDHWRRNGLPEVITVAEIRQALDMGDTQAKQTHSSLLRLGLIDATSLAPTDTMRELLNPANRKQVLSNLVQRVYAEVVGPINLFEANVADMKSAFRRAYGITNERTLDRAVAFFRHIAHAAGLPLSYALLPDKRPIYQRGRPGLVEALRAADEEQAAPTQEDHEDHEVHEDHEAREEVHDMYPGSGSLEATGNAADLPTTASDLLSVSAQVLRQLFAEATPKQRRYLLSVAGNLDVASDMLRELRELQARKNTTDMRSGANGYARP